MATARLLKNTTANLTGLDIILDGQTPCVFQATITGDGTVSSTVTVQGTNEPPKEATSLWFDINVFSLTGTDDDNQIHNSLIPYNAVRAITASITGTDAAVNVTASY